MRNIAKRNGLSTTALFRHKRDHLPQKLTLARHEEDTLSAQGLLEEMAHLKARLRSGLEQAEAARNPHAFLGFSREYRATLEAYFAISERMAEKAQGPKSFERAVMELSQSFGFDKATKEELDEAIAILQSPEP